jgi:hypothetical protein
MAFPKRFMNVFHIYHTFDVEASVHGQLFHWLSYIVNSVFCFLEPKIRPRDHQALVHSDQMVLAMAR